MFACYLKNAFNRRMSPSTRLFILTGEEQLHSKFSKSTATKIAIKKLLKKYRQIGTVKDED